MIFLKLNVLSPQKKNRFTKLVHFIFFKQILEFILLTAAILAIIHLLGMYVLSQTVSDLAVSTLAVNREQLTSNREVRQINKLTKNISDSGQGYAEISPLLVSFVNQIPSTITVQLLQVDRTTNTFLLAGVASTREELLAFKEIADTVSWITNLSSPTSQLFQKEDVQFEIRGNLVNLSLAQ